MAYSYEYNPYNSHHKLIASRYDSNMDTVKSNKHVKLIEKKVKYRSRVILVLRLQF